MNWRGLKDKFGSSVADTQDKIQKVEEKVTIYFKASKRNREGYKKET